jgi:cytoskeletal protein RodZ
MTKTWVDESFTCFHVIRVLAPFCHALSLWCGDRKESILDNSQRMKKKKLTKKRIKNNRSEILCLVYIQDITKSYFLIYRFRLVKEFDRELKDEEGKNPPEVNKQLNDEKQSMVSIWNLLFLHS